METLASDLADGFAEETVRVVADRLAAGAVAFAVAIGAAWGFEHLAHPGRDAAYAFSFAGELVTLLLAVALARQPWGRRYSAAIAAVAGVGLMAWIAAYYIRVHGAAEVLGVVLVYVTIGMAVLLPWGWRWQSIVVVAAAVAFAAAVRHGAVLTVPLPMNALGFGAVALLSLPAAAFQYGQRWRLHQQAAELRAANAALRESDRQKNRFIASMSHELRSPLSVIVGYADLLRDGSFGPLSVEAGDVIERIARSARSLTYLVSDIVDLARIEADRLVVHLRPVELAPVFAAMEAFVGPQIRDKPVRFSCEPPGSLTVTADPGRLEQILVNLLSNALKFTQRGEVRLRAVARESGMVRIEVTDTGPGIEPGELSRIFEPYHQGSAGTALGGLGIGLSVSARLAGAMHGLLTAQSEVGHGATFALELPAAGAA